MSGSTLDLSSLESRARTAMTRTELSRPVSLALQDGLVTPGRSVLDFGCGRGGDVERLRALGHAVRGWDPVHAPDGQLGPADVVNLGFVVNVIDSPAERVQVLRQSWELARRVLIVAARPEWEAREVGGRSWGDGVVTGKGTFQKFFGQQELADWIEQTLEAVPYAAGPGIFYVFRDARDGEALGARQVRRSSSTPRLSLSRSLYEEHRPLLQALAAFLGERGRLPDVSELREGEAIVSIFGSVRQAYAILGRATGQRDWSQEARAARENLLVYLALAGFRGRRRMSALPDDLQRDVRAHFGSHRAAVSEADALLFSISESEAVTRAIKELPFGKVLPDAVYFHKTTLPLLPPLLRVYEGCARVLLGRVPAEVVKFHRVDRKVSYLFYPSFDDEAHPPLAASLRADLRSFSVKFRDYRESASPPILHRKEVLLHPEHPLHPKFAKLTRQEERADLLGIPGIGTRRTWERLLAEEGWRIAGHRLLSTQPRRARARHA